MIPTVDERLASVVRALTDVVMPSLPPEAGLAMEQIHLSVGHIQIIRSQLDATPDFEREELADAVSIGEALMELSGGTETRTALAALQQEMDVACSAVDPVAVRSARNAIHGAVTAVIGAVSADGAPDSHGRLRRIIIAYEQPRAMKDRRWSAPFGFDSVAAE